MANKIVTFGELMLRLAPNGYLRFVQSDELEATFGGAEGNVAVSLANFGEHAVFVTKLPAHEIGQMKLFAVEAESVFIIVKRVHRSARARSFMTARVRLLPFPPPRITIGQTFSRVQDGSMLQA